MHAKPKLKPRKGKWLEEYPCGCSSVQPRKKDLLGYCSVHGDSCTHVYRLPQAVDIGLAH